MSSAGTLAGLCDDGHCHAGKIGIGAMTQASAWLCPSYALAGRHLPSSSR
jgi:hypothetical protein